MISAIVAVDENWGIGYQNQLLEHIPADLKHFKELTLNSMVVMGRKTWESLPKKPLPDRFNIVISSTQQEDCLTFSFDSIKQWLPIMKSSNIMDVFIIGGGALYKDLLPYCDKAYVTKINKSHENVDTYFPNLDAEPGWKIGEAGPPQFYQDMEFSFMVYEKIY